MSIKLVLVFALHLEKYIETFYIYIVHHTCSVTFGMNHIGAVMGERLHTGCSYEQDSKYVPVDDSLTLQ